MKNIDGYDLGDRLQKMRKRSDLSQKEVASRIGKHVNTIAKYESNNLDPPIKILRKLALLYNCSSDYLLGIDDSIVLKLDDISPKGQAAVLEIYGQLKEK